MKTNTDVSKALASKLSPVALAVAMTVPAISNIAVAQEAEATEEQQFEAITVTATKRPQVIYEVPIAISAFDGDKLADQGITDLTDVGKFVPNLNVTGFSAGHTSSVNPFIRGIGLQDHLITTDPGVSVYVDGVYLGRQVGQNWSLNNIERIEVLRGPQGTLYGRNSIGGAINIITKEPDQGDVTKVNTEFGTRGRVKADIFVIGEDWGRKPHNQGVENYLKGQGKKIVQIKYNPRTSSTKIKQNIIAQFQRNKDIEQEIEKNICVSERTFPRDFGKLGVI